MLRFFSSLLGPSGTTAPWDSGRSHAQRFPSLDSIRILIR